MKKKEPKIEQPSEESQREYQSLVEDDATVVSIIGTKKTYKIHWLKNGQVLKLGRLLIHKQETDDKDEKQTSIWNEFVDDNKLACKAAAIIILNGYWKIKFRYWFLWRWFYYIKQYDNSQLQPILDEGKKKVPLTQYYVTIMSLTEAKDTLMNMRMAEAERILRELSMAQQSQAAKNDNGSQHQDTSSSDS